MDVSALVVTWNSASDVAACLDAALAQVGVDLEVVVIDNASTDETLDVLARFADEPRVRVLPQQENLGYAEANNIAALAAAGRVLLILNPDCAMEPGCAAALVRHLDTTPGAGAAAAMLRYPDGRPQSFLRRDASFGIAMWAFLEVARRVDGRLLRGRHNAHRIYGELDGAVLTDPVSVDCPAAACVAVPRALAQGQLLDPRLPLFFNDADLYRRLRRRAYTVQVVPDAFAVHRYGGSVEAVPAARRRAEMVAALREYVAHGWSTAACATLWVALVIDALICLPLPRTRHLARGTLGGLGLPGGERPWLQKVPPLSRRVRAAWWRVKGSPRRRANAASRWWRRRRFLRLARWGARLSGCPLTLEVAATADLPKRVRFEFLPNRPVTLTIGDHALVRPELVIRLGGILHIGPWCELRQGVVLNVKGVLDLGPRVVLGRGAMVHADQRMVWEWGATTGEYVSVLDNDHEMDRSLVHVFDQAVTTGQVVIGAASLLGGHSVVLPGCRVGRAATVGAGSIVTADVPDRAVAVGAPARVVSGRSAGRRRSA